MSVTRFTDNPESNSEFELLLQEQIRRNRERLNYPIRPYRDTSVVTISDSREIVLSWQHLCDWWKNQSEWRKGIIVILMTVLSLIIGCIALCTSNSMRTTMKTKEDTQKSDGGAFDSSGLSMGY